MNPTCEVWPENWNAVLVFEALRTQWRHGFGGPTGLIYSEIPLVVEMLGLGEEITNRKELFSSLRVMEGAVLSYIARKQKQEKDRGRGR